MYSVGQRVVCIDAEFSDFIKSLYVELPVKDTVYTIRDVMPGIGADNKTYEVAVLLVELKNNLNNHPVPTENAFNVERFAPLDPNFEVEIEKEAAPLKHHGALVHASN